MVYVIRTLIDTKRVSPLSAGPSLPFDRLGACHCSADCPVPCSSCPHSYHCPQDPLHTPYSSRPSDFLCVPLSLPLPSVHDTDTLLLVQGQLPLLKSASLQNLLWSAFVSSPSWTLHFPEIEKLALASGNFGSAADWVASNKSFPLRCLNLRPEWTS